MNPRILLLAIGMFATGTNSLIMTGVLSEVAFELQTTEALAGLGVTVFAAAFAISAPFIPIVFTRLGRRSIMVIGLSLFIAGSIGAIVAGGLGWFLASRVLVGVGAATFVPQATAAALSLADDEHRGRALAVLTLGLTGSIALGSPLGAVVGGAFGYRAAFALIVLLGTAGLVALLWVPRVAKPSIRDGESQFGALRNRGVVVIALTTALIATGINTLTTYFTPLFRETAGVERGAIPIVMGTFGLFAVASMLVGGRLIDRIGGFAVAGSALAIFGASSVGLAFAGSFVAVLVVIAPWSFASNISIVAQQFEIAKLEADAAPALALNSTGVFAGVALGASLGSLALAIAPTTDLPLFAAGPVFLALAITVIQIVRSRRRYSGG